MIRLCNNSFLICQAVTEVCHLSWLQHYFTDAWNSFDALIVVGSVVDIVVTEFSVSLQAHSVSMYMEGVSILSLRSKRVLIGYTKSAQFTNCIMVSDHLHLGCESHFRYTIGLMSSGLEQKSV